MTLSADVRPTRPVEIIALGVAALNVLVFALIAEDVLDGGGLISRDQAVLDWFVKNRTSALIESARFVSTVGGFIGLLTLSVLLAVFLRFARRPWPLAVAPMAALFLAGFSATLAKWAFGRPRPPEQVHAVKVTLDAFPSSHAADAAACLLAAALVLSLTVITRRVEQVLLVIGALVLAGVVGLSRLVLGVHWLSDVVAGWAVGITLAIVVVLSSWILATRRVEFGEGRGGHMSPA